MSDKPVIFISHSSKDGEVVQILTQQMELCFAGKVEIFASTIQPGENWFQKVMEKLNQADAIVTLITPNSVNESHWVWFELGYFWARHDESLKNPNDKKKVYYPVYWKVTPDQWPNPVKDLQIQAVPISDQNGLLEFFRVLCDQFDGDLAQADLTRVISNIEERSRIEVSNASEISDFLSNYRG